MDTARAKALFGRPLRLLLAAWILGRGGRPFYLTEAQDAMRLHNEAPSGVAKELRLFAEHEMLLEVREANRVYFTQVKSPLWDAFRAIVCALNIAIPETESSGVE